MRFLWNTARRDLIYIRLRFLLVLICFKRDLRIPILKVTCEEDTRFYAHLRYREIVVNPIERYSHISEENEYHRAVLYMMHELGHLVQIDRHYRWHQRKQSLEERERVMSNEEYIKLPTERNASKIANILVKMYCPKIEGRIRV